MDNHDYTQIYVVDEELTQCTYHPTEYRDSTWEIVGEPPHALEFIPSKFDVVKHDASLVNPMFADFGGVQNNSEGVRWHLPADIEYHAPDENSDEPEIPTTALTDEEIENIKKAAFDEGKAAAEAEFNQKLAEQDQIYSQKVTEILDDIQKQINDDLAQNEKQCLELALAISKKIIDGAVEINPEYIIDIINKAVSLAGTADIKTIKVSPQDYEFIDVIGITKSIKGYQSGWKFESDPLIKAGCVVETSAGEIDYQLDPAWERVQDQILKIAK